MKPAKRTLDEKAAEKYANPAALKYETLSCSVENHMHRTKNNFLAGVRYARMTDKMAIGYSVACYSKEQLNIKKACIAAIKERGRK